MKGNEELEALLRVVSEIAKDVRAMREELEWQRKSRERNRHEEAPLNVTWSDPNETGTPYRTGRSHAWGVSKRRSD